ncbi:MAG TPA: hypothetical protein VK157_07755 [Phycisphaerales bacterium]|nr:hypothetical protein [Phycisphaerales bacterium]
MKSSGKSLLLSAATLAVVAGSVSAVEPNGLRDSGSYQQIWVNNQPTSYGDNVPGSIGTAGNPEAVTRGVEFAVPLAGLGNPALNNIRLTAVFGPGNNLSNQVIGADPLPTSGTYNSVPFSGGHPALGNGRNVDFSNNAVFPGNQFLTLSVTRVSTQPTLDGVLDGDVAGGTGGWWAGSRQWVQSNYTSLSNNTQPEINTANGSELNNLYARVYDNGTAGDTTDDILYIFIGGNWSGFNRMGLFFDTIAGGQQQLLPTSNLAPAYNADWGFGYTNQIGGTYSTTTGTTTGGLKFDNSFDADFLFVMNSNGNDHYWDFLTLTATNTGGNASYIGTNTALVPNAGALGGGSAGVIAGSTTPVLSVINNSNVIGVDGAPVGVSLIPSRDLAGGSELNNLYGYVDDAGTPGDASDDRLKLHFGGNLETNFNGLVLFFDSIPGEGQNQLFGQSSPVRNPGFDANNGLNRMGAGSNGATAGDPPVAINGGGLKFEADFAADYVLRVGNGNNPVEVYANAAVLRTNGRDEISGFQIEFTADNGGSKLTNDPITFPGSRANANDFTNADFIPNTDAGPRATYAPFSILNPPINPVTAGPAGLIKVAIDNNNVAGVTGTGAGASVSGADAVTQGVEIDIALSEIGWDGTGELKVAGFIASSDYSNISNQILGGIDSGVAFFENNLGESSTLDLTAIAGTQYVVITGGAAGCDSIDFNGNEVFPEDQDVIDFFNVLAGGTCP